MTASSSKRPGDTPTRNKSKSRTSEKQQSKTEKSKGKGKEKEKDLSGAGTSRTEGGFKTGVHDAGGRAAKWDWRAISESTSSTVPPIFTKDGSYFFSIIESSVKIHSTATGQVVSTLTPDASSTNILTCATLNPHNVFQLITGSLNGQIVIWDFLEGVILQTIDIEQPIQHICAHKKFEDTIFVAAGKASSKKKGAEDKSAILRVSLRPSAETANLKVQKTSSMTPIGKADKPTVGLSFSPSGAWLVAAAGHKAHVAPTDKLEAGFTKFVSNERLTCLAFHPDEEYFATGDEKGQIRLWYCLNGDLATASQVTGVGKKAQTTRMHWHAHAVSSLVFTLNGAYLLSGGEEAVLVIWQLHTGKKEFVPRVGAPISTVSLSRAQDGTEEYLLGLADSTYLFINSATLKPSRSYTRVKIDPSHTTTASAYAPLAYHAATSTLILPSSHTSSLQVYSPVTSKVLSELEVVPSSRVSRRDEEPLEPPAVENVVVSDSGEWMATVDHRPGDGSFRAEIQLKLWWWDKNAGQWTLNTRIESPHALSPVQSVDFQPAAIGQPLHLVTCSLDGSVKTWRIRTIKNKAGEHEDFWILRSTIAFRNEKPQSVAFSPCGSLLAVVLKSHVALYDPSTNVQLDTLSLPECPTLQSAHFAGKGRYLVLAGARDLILWDVILQNVHWHHHSTQDIARLVVHPAGDTFAVFQKGHNATKVTIHRLAAPNPIQTHNMPFSIRSLLWNASAQVQKGCYSLIAITQTWSVVEFGDHVQPTDGQGSRGISAQGPSSQKPSLFADIFGSLSLGEPATGPSRAHVETWRGKEGAEVFDGPAYLLPPLGSLYTTLMDGFLKVRAEPSAGDSKDGDADVEMEDAAAVDEKPPASSVTGRSVEKEEIETLVGLFKQNSLSAPTPSKGAAAKVNGVKVNGAGHHASSPLSTPKQNGHVQRKPTKGQQPITTPLNHPPISPTSSDSSDSPAPVNTGNAKKRKKVS